MNTLGLGSRLKSGERLFGTLIVSPSPRWPDTVATLGLDFVFIDTEHVALDRAQVSWMCQAYQARGLPPLVRIPSPDPYQACMALDAGAAGIVAPYVETVAQVRALRGAVRYRPIKGARLDAALEDPAVLEPGLADYLEARNRETLLVINIESIPAIDHLDELLEEPGVDAVLIGPHDLSCSLGVPEQYDHPRFQEAVLAIIRRARSHGVAAGIHSWMSLDRIITWAESGLNLIIHSADIIAMRETLGSEVRELRKRLGHAAGAESDAGRSSGR